MNRLCCITYAYGLSEIGDEYHRIQNGMPGMIGDRIPTVKLKIPRKSMGKSGYRTSELYQWQRHFLYFLQFFHGSVIAKSQPLSPVFSLDQKL